MESVYTFVNNPPNNGKIYWAPDFGNRFEYLSKKIPEAAAQNEGMYLFEN